ncbi:uncharacterized protein PGRI_064420 [Penicillium griseofulvum]|uniref:Zn(2)-C6 fungal-type domain-containing protein n=1 Tax=Penicillium patulum TaxID=5078 RepID=A0A135LPI8_PENPA|nr:uncharacterized protein PGRI_064420 [Penicillium griseofulvum]KXG50870.1 hypothetical protein PGRI_064420 [Penicillium griseofulvum]
MSQTWQLSSMIPTAYETQPIDPEILQLVNGIENDPMDNQSQELDVPGGPVSFDSMIAIPTIEDQPQSSVSPICSNPRPPTLPSSGTDSWSCTSGEHDRAQSACSNGETQPFIEPVRPLSPTLEELYPDGFVPWDPTDPAKSDNIRERIPRNQAEIQQQREDTAALKKAGGSCMACYRAKKKCGTTTPCPPCSSKGNRICFRSWGDLCLLGPPTGNSLMILGFPSQEAKDNLHRMSEEVFKRTNAFRAVVNIRETYGGACTAWNWTATKSSITLSSWAECPIDDFLARITNALPLMDLVKLEEQHKSNTLVWNALGIANVFMAIQGLAQARIRTSWFEITTGRLVSFYILILSFRKLAQMSQEFCPCLYVALCGKDKQNNKKSRSRKESEIDPAWVAAALYYRVVCGLQDLQNNPVVARIFGSSSYHLSGVREKLEDILRSMPPRHGPTGKSSSRVILEDDVPKFPSSLDIDMAFWLGVPDDPEQTPSVSSRQDSPFSPPACEMQVFLADHFPRPWRVVDHLEQHHVHDTIISEEQNASDNMAYIDQTEMLDSNILFNFLGNDNYNAFDPMAATFVDTLDTMPLNGNFPQSLYNC